MEQMHSGLQCECSYHICFAISNRNVNVVCVVVTIMDIISLRKIAKEEQQKTKKERAPIVRTYHVIRVLQHKEQLKYLSTIVWNMKTHNIASCFLPDEFENCAQDSRKSRRHSYIQAPYVFILYLQLSPTNYWDSLWQHQINNRQFWETLKQFYLLCIPNLFLWFWHYKTAANCSIDSTVCSEIPNCLE